MRYVYFSTNFSVLNLLRSSCWIKIGFGLTASLSFKACAFAFGRGCRRRRIGFGLTNSLDFFFWMFRTFPRAAMKKTRESEMVSLSKCEIYYTYKSMIKQNRADALLSNSFRSQTCWAWLLHGYLFFRSQLFLCDLEVSNPFEKPCFQRHVCFTSTISKLLHVIFLCQNLPMRQVFRRDMLFVQNFFLHIHIPQCRFFEP